MHKCSKKTEKKYVSKSDSYNAYRGLYFQYGTQGVQLRPDQAAEFGHVHLKTAFRWLNGTQEPHPAVKELLFLKATGRILPYSSDWETIHVNDDGKLVLANGNDYHPNELLIYDMQKAELANIKHQIMRDRDRLGHQAFEAASLAFN